MKSDSYYTVKEMKFNLVDDPWIKVIGKPKQSLRSFFADLTNTGFCGNAIEKIAMLRFMLSLTHAAIEIPDEKAWNALTPEIISEKVINYLEKHHDCFELFGEHPFLQFPQLNTSNKMQDFQTMYPNVSSGNKSVLTHWNLPDFVDISDIPLLLLRGCGFGFGGKKSDNSIVLSKGYCGKQNDKGKPASGSAGTLIGFQGYLHSYLYGTSILDTIHLNLLTTEDIKGLDFYSEIGRPVWENMPTGEDCETARHYKTTYQGMLLPLDKFFLLFPEDKKIVITDGISYPTHLTGLRDPALTIYTEKNKNKAIWAKTSHRPWRELPALLAFLQPNHNNPSPYFLSYGIGKLPADTVIHIWTAGLQVSSNAGEQYVSGKDDYIESDFYFPNIAKDNGDVIRSKFCNMMTEIESYAKVLYASVNSYFKTMFHAGSADNAAAAVELFWELMEKDAQMLLNAACEIENNDLIPDDLKKRWKKLVFEIYNKYCPRETARQLLAWSESKPFAKEKSSKKGK